MKTLKFTGYSDDTFMCEGPGIDVDHDDCANGRLRAIQVKDSDGNGLIVTGQYCPGGRNTPIKSWNIGIGLLSGDAAGEDCRSLPGWPMRFVDSERDYSPRLEIDAPNDAIATLILPSE